MLRLLTYTSLYPNAALPQHGVFVEERLRHLCASGKISATVVAPVPWFPFKARAFGRYALMARAPASEIRHGITVIHPRYPVIPKVGMYMTPGLMYRFTLSAVRAIQKHTGDFDLIDAHYFYPDGIAAVQIAQRLNKPVVITARGTDINVFPNYRGARRKIIWAAKHSAAVVAVSEDLKQHLISLGIASDKITVLRNGVDLERFRPITVLPKQSRLDVLGPVWIYVGHLVALKGVDLVIKALAAVPGITLLIIGTGPEEKRLRALAATLQVSERIRFLGAIAHEQLSHYYNLADALLLASSREGMPNVILEALACGTPVIASKAGGIVEVLQSSKAGVLLPTRTPNAIIEAWQQLQAQMHTRESVRAFAQQLDWAPTVSAQVALYADVCGQRPLGTQGAA